MEKEKELNSALDDIAGIYMSWMMSPELANRLLDDDPNNPLCMKVIKKRFDVWGITVKIPYALAAIFTFCVNGNPGLFMMQMAEMFKSCQDKFKADPEYIIQPYDFLMFCLSMNKNGEFPICYPEYDHGPENKDELDRWVKLWDSQKTETGANLADTKEWWMKIIYGEETKDK